MLIDIVQARAMKSHQLWIQFEDGVNGVIDLKALIAFTGVFAPLRDQIYFEQVRVNPDLGTVSWPNGADLDPDVLYSIVSGEPLPNLGLEYSSDQERDFRTRVETAQRSIRERGADYLNDSSDTMG